MKVIRCLSSLFLVSTTICLGQRPSLQDFVLIKGGTFRSGPVEHVKEHPLLRVEDFEMLDHPVTNRQYKLFIDATGHPSPSHWVDSKIPRGKEDHPVVFVNRADVREFLKWLTKKEGRIYRLPTTAEFEYASRGGRADTKYPWGHSDPKGRANFDANGWRRFDRWQDYLLAAKWGQKNGYGLFGMAGNVWQMTVTRSDPAIRRWMYRIEDPDLLEGTIMGGSWARTAEFLQCGYRLGVSPGIRHPDVGFRPVRQPDGSDWGILPRRLGAVSRGDGQVFLSWALFKNDSPSTRFSIYRASARNHAGFLVSESPIEGTTSFLDTGLSVGKRYHYYVRPIDQSGKEGPRSQWVGVTVSDEPSSVLTSFSPLYKQGGLVPVFGDLNGDGTLDCVIRMDNGNREMSQDPGVPVQLEAFTSWGRSLWRRDVSDHDQCYGNANNVPFNVWDMDGDGKAEVITRLQIGDLVYLAILDGLTGQVKRKAPWLEMVSDTQKSSTRIHLSVAYLDGVHPGVVTQTGLYENEVFAAYDAQLNKLWQFESFYETSGSGGHKIEVADVDGDGKQEVFDGTTCLNADGTLRWSIFRQHPDIVSIHDYLPDRPGLEVFYIVESSVHAGVYMVDANSGQVIWKVNREDDPRWTHGHSGWTADIWDGSSGMECVSNRAGHNDRDFVLFSADGRILLEHFPAGYTPLEWDGDRTRELLLGNGQKIGKFNGKEIVPLPGQKPNPFVDSQLLMVADLYGDFRDELVLTRKGKDGRRVVAVITAPQTISKMRVTPTEDREYRLWLARNMGGGYRSIYDRPLILVPEN
ncbi:SUMF1/EgtB/PvdO family nonheme iron enzyme [Acidobacteria bacterium AH-259-O06]|nr:SUMF1/EgtB/PvdO family nonheme iron enzyme [Acidobacteria bacterium AH-259-O06]